MNEIFVLSVRMKDDRTINIGAFLTKDIAERAIAALVERRKSLLKETLAEAIKTDDGEEFDGQYEDFLHTKELANNIHSYKVEHFIVNKNLFLT